MDGFYSLVHQFSVSLSRFCTTSQSPHRLFRDGGRVLPSDQCPRILRQFNILTFDQSQLRQSSVELLERIVVRTFLYPAILMPVAVSIMANNLHFVQRAQLLQLSLLCCNHQ